VQRLPAPLGFFTLLALWSLAFTAGCRASVKTSVDASAEASATSPEPAPAGAQTSVPEVVAAPPRQTAFIGVTHALTLSPEAAKTPACTCVAAKVGDPGSPGFVWRGQAPTVGEDAVVLALTSNGVPCERESKGRGASIQGVVRSGADVIVTLEEASAGRPLAEGAIVPRPQKGGDIVIRPAGRGVPYARAAADGTYCRLPVQ
jgi:hypothetical protein